MNSNSLRVALITGAGTGIGKAAAKALLADGFCIVLTGRKMERLTNAIEEIGGNDKNCLAVSCDIGKPDEVKALFAALKSKFGRIDVLFNIAGTGAPAMPMDELSYEQWMNVYGCQWRWISGYLYAGTEDLIGSFNARRDHAPHLFLYCFLWCWYRIIVCCIWLDS